MATAPTNNGTVNNDIQVGQASTNCAPSYFRANIYGTEAVLDPTTGTTNNLMDFMKYNYTSSIVQTSSTGTIVWTGAVPITTIAYNTYGNTTVYWLILAFNGFTSVDDIPIGTLLELPSLSLINSLISNTNTNSPTNIGQVVSI